MKVYEQLLGRRSHRDSEARFGFQDWVNLFTFNGNNYPLLNQSWGSISEEQIVASCQRAVVENGPTFALVLARMQLFSQARFVWRRQQSGATDTFGTPALSLLERPWVGGTTGDLLARMELDVSQAGNSYHRRLPNRLGRMRPDWVRIVLGSHEDADHPEEASDVEVIGYLYQPPRGKSVILQPFEVAHYAPIPDPSFHFLGMSWITPVISDVSADSASTLHKRKFFQNAATPNLAIKFDPSIGIEQVREFKSLLEEEHAGAWNAYKTLYLGGGADATPIGKDFKELDFAATQGKGESRLASAAGVPPSWVGFSEGLQGSALNAGNFTAARRRFGDGTMHHLWANAAASLENVVTPRPGGAELWYDVDDIPFMREDAKDAAEVQKAQASTITQLVREGFTADSAVKAVTASDWTLLKHSGYVSVQLQLPGADGTAKPATDPGTTPQEGDDDGED